MSGLTMVLHVEIGKGIKYFIGNMGFHLCLDRNWGIRLLNISYLAFAVLSVKGHLINVPRMEGYFKGLYQVNHFHW